MNLSMIMKNQPLSTPLNKIPIGSERMYYCQKCNETFSEPDSIQENGLYSFLCPYCYDSDFQELIASAPCQRCAKTFSDSDLENGLCPHCREEIEHKFLSLVRENIPVEEQECIWRTNWEWVCHENT